MLLPEGALLWAKSLFVADLHLGKGAAFRAGLVPIPAGSSACTLLKLASLAHEHPVDTIVVLGDMWHAKEGRSPANIQLLRDWRTEVPCKRVILVEGNHDRRSGALPDHLDIEEVKEDVQYGPFALRHYPDPSDLGYVLCGHIHPAVRLTGKGKQAVGLKCFWFTERVGVLPAFGEFTGVARVDPKPEDQVFVLADGRVLPVK